MGLGLLKTLRRMPFLMTADPGGIDSLFNRMRRRTAIKKHSGVETTVANIFG
jgi:hypothetical protein